MPLPRRPRAEPDRGSQKALWNYACREGGDVYKFVMKLEGLDFRSAHVRLGGRDLPTPGGNGVGPSQPAEEGAKPDPARLQTVVEHYHQTLLRTPPALDYLKSRGVGSPELVTTFKTEVHTHVEVSDLAQVLARCRPRGKGRGKRSPKS